MSCLSCKCDCETASARVRKVCVRTKNTKLTVVAGTELGRSPFIIYNYLYGPKAGWVKKKTKACYSCCCSDTHIYIKKDSAVGKANYCFVYSTSCENKLGGFIFFSTSTALKILTVERQRKHIKNQTVGSQIQDVSVEH